MSVAIENAVVDRIAADLNVQAPGFDPALISGLIEFLMTIVTGACGGSQPQPATPEQAIARVKALTPWQQYALKARAVNYLKAKKIRNAKKDAPIAVDVAVTQAKKATKDEQIALATYITKLGSDDYTFDQM